MSNRVIARCGKKPYATHSGNAFRNQWLSVKPGSTIGNIPAPGSVRSTKSRMQIGKR